MARHETKNKQSTKERIVIANAQFLLAKYGFENVTLADIAKGYKINEEEIPYRGGQVSIGVVRKLFLKKEDIVRKIFDIWWNLTLEKIEEIVNLKCSASEKLKRCLEQIPRLLEEDLDAVAVLIRERYPNTMGEGDRECPASLRCLRISIDLIEQIENEGELKVAKKDARTVAHCFYGAIEHGMLDAYLQFNRPDNSNKPAKVKEAEKVLEAHEEVGRLVETLLSMANGILKVKT